MTIDFSGIPAREEKKPASQGLEIDFSGIPTRESVRDTSKEIDFSGIPRKEPAQIEPEGEGLHEGFIKPTLKDIPRVGAALGSGLWGMLAGGAKGAVEFITGVEADPSMPVFNTIVDTDPSEPTLNIDESLDRAGQVLEETAGFYSDFYLKTPEQQKAVQNVMKPMEWVDKAGEFYGDYAENKWEPIVGKEEAANIGASVKTAFQFVAYFGLPELGVRLKAQIKAGQLKEAQVTAKRINEIRLETEKLWAEKLKKEPSRPLAELSKRERKIADGIRNKAKRKAKAVEADIEAAFKEKPKSKPVVEKPVPEAEPQKYQELLDDTKEMFESGEMSKKDILEYAESDQAIKLGIDQKLKEIVAERREQPRPTRKQVEAELEAPELTLERAKEIALESTEKAYRDSLTNLENPRAYEEYIAEQRKIGDKGREYQASADLDNFSWGNDVAKHTYGDQLLREFAKIASEEGARVFRKGGDEFIITHADKTKLDLTMKRISDRLKSEIDHIFTVEERVELADGTVYEPGDVLQQEGIGLSYGIDKRFSAADKSLQKHKAQRTAAGERAPKGTQPTTVHRVEKPGSPETPGSPAQKPGVVSTQPTKPAKAAVKTPTPEVPKLKWKDNPVSKVSVVAEPTEAFWNWYNGKGAGQAFKEYGIKVKKDLTGNWFVSQLNKFRTKSPKPATPAAVKTPIPKEKPKRELTPREKKLQAKAPSPEGKLTKVKAGSLKKGQLVDLIDPETQAWIGGRVTERGASGVTIDIGGGKTKRFAAREFIDIFKSEKGAVELPGTAKRAHERTMSTSPAWRKVHGSIGKRETGVAKFFKAIKESPKEAAKAGISKLAKIFTDRFQPLKDTTPKTYEAAAKYSSYKDISIMKVQALAEGLKGVRNNELAFTDYVMAKRDAVRAKRGLENPDGVTLQDANNTVKAIESWAKQEGVFKELQEASANFQKWADKHILRDLVDSGMLSEKQYAAIKKGNEYYAAFDIISDVPVDINKISTEIKGEYFNVTNNKVIRKMVGTEKKTTNPIAATLAKFVDAQAVAARNRVASIFVEDPKIKPLLKRVATSQKELIILKRQGIDAVLQGAKIKGYDTINRFKNGQIERYLVPEELAGALKQLTPRQAPRAIQALGNVFRKTATTIYIPFTISNAFRDAFMAYTTAPVYKGKLYQFGIDWAQGLFEGVKHEFFGKSKVAQDYIKNGGGFGYVGNLRKAQVAKAQLFKEGLGKQIITSPKHLFKTIEKVSSAVELAPRLGVYKRGVKQGASNAESAFMARRSTIDFNRGGVYTKALNQWVPFLNARVQARVTLADALRRDPKGTIAKGFVSTFIPGMTTYALNRLYFSDLYDDIPGYIKDQYFCAIYGSKINEQGKEVPQYLSIPKGDIGQMMWNPWEFGIDKWYKKDREGFIKFAVNWVSDLSPVQFARDGEISGTKIASGLLPPIVKGVVENQFNESFWSGMNIDPHWAVMEGKPPELMWRETKKSVPATYKKLSLYIKKKTGWGVSPFKLQNLASSVFAGYGREGLDPDAMLRGLTGRLVKSKGGQKERSAGLTIRDIDSGYVVTRAYAEYFIDEGKKSEAIKLMREWNDGLKARIKKMEDFGFKDKGGLIREYRFSSEKMINIIRKKPDTRSYVEKKLSRR